MSCEQYSSGTNAEITLTEHSLPVGFCPATWQDVLHAFIAATSGNLPGSYSTLVVSAATPSPDDQDKLWLKVDTTTCHPEGFYLFFNGAWARVDGGVFYGEDNSTAVGTINVPTLEPNISWLETAAAKQLFVIKANTGNTGAVTLQLPLGIAAMTVTKYGGVALEGYEIRPGMLCLFAYDVAAGKFQLLNPRPNIPTVEGLENPSFEVDADGDGIPDLWVRANTFGGPYTGVIDSLWEQHGANCYKIEVHAPPAGSQNGYETLTTQHYIKCDPNEVIYITWMMSADATAGDKPVSLNVIPITRAGAVLSEGAAVQIWSRNLDALTDYPNPPDSSAGWAKFGAIYQAGGTVVAFKLQIQVGDTAASGKVKQWVYFDDFRIGLPTFPNGNTFSTSGTVDWTCPATKYSARIRTWGGGGGGRTGVGIGGGGGGGGGGYSERFADVIPATDYPCVIGAGGLMGLVGGATSFNSTGTNEVSSVAGSGSAGVAGGAGGALGVGTVRIAGCSGEDGDGAVAPFDGGRGGYSPNGGGYGRKHIHAIAQTASSNAPGGGGGGAEFPAVGSAGAAGMIIIEWF